MSSLLSWALKGFSSTPFLFSATAVPNLYHLPQGSYQIPVSPALSRQPNLLPSPTKQVPMSSTTSASVLTSPVSSIVMPPLPLHSSLRKRGIPAHSIINELAQEVFIEH